MIDNNYIQTTDDDLKVFLEEFFSYFEDGFAFEEFLKVYLEKFGLDEVSVTRRHRDGGIDLKAILPGSTLHDADVIHYDIQAKCYRPDKIVPISKVREFRGVLPAGHRGLFITTAKFTRDTIAFSLEDPSRPITLIDGIDLIKKSIQHQIGFRYIPVFDASLLEQLMMQRPNPSVTEITNDHFSVSKMITSNDMRAKILSIPSDIYKKIPEDLNRVTVLINEDEHSLKINRSRKYLSGVTSIYRNFGLISEEGEHHPVTAVWIYENNKISIMIPTFTN